MHYLIVWECCLLKNAKEFVNSERSNLAFKKLLVKAELGNNIPLMQWFFPCHFPLSGSLYGSLIS